ncbi:MAG: flagellar M-ring protein FliF C-terminal domain-containing protein, partial [SAR324 cluster bacterium]|nr:flagellar M-ring protein FliF C-terminal domain-containing protein [SAR324 cluster bacterium]
VEEHYTVMTGEESSSPSPNRIGDIAKDIESETRSSSQSVSGVGLPIPGFDFEVEPEPAAPADDIEVEEELYEPLDQSSAEKQRHSRTHKEIRPSVASVKSLDISIILQEGASPELIENIRQVVMVASRFNRARGDVLSIMTASFKERRDEKTAEHILLKNIAEKLESLEEQTAEEEDSWKSELDRYKENEAQRREEDRLYFQSKLAELEIAARSRAYEDEKSDMLQDDSMKLQSLNDEIQELRNLISSAPDSALQAQMDMKEGEKEQLDAQIAEKTAMLESVQADLDRRSGGGSTMMVVFMSILGALVIVLVVVLVMVLMGNKNKQQAFPPPPPPWMYPPRPRKKKDNTVNGESKEKQHHEPAKVQSAVEDPSVIQSEINDMKQAVVSMSVGQPSTATKIVQDWIVTEAPAPPEPEAAEAEPSEDDEDDGGKKKKKKKKK